MVKRFGTFTAVDHLDLHIDNGEMVVLLGPSGCGKTTTLRCIGGLEEISEGEIWIGDKIVSGRNVSIPTEKREIGMVFQSYAIWPHMSVAENVAFGLRARRVASSEIGERVRKALDMVGLGAFADRGASALSGGQQQRVALARAVILEPQILLFDEPLSNLDARLRDRMRLELRDVQKRIGITSVYVTHDQQEAMALADRIVLMDHGQIAQMGKPSEIYNFPRSLFVAEFVGSANVVAGEILEDKEKRVVRVGEHLALDVGSSGLTPGAVVDALIRPERVRLSNARAEGINAFPAKVRNSVFFGNFSEYEIDLGGIQLRSQMSPPIALENGCQVWASIAPEDIVLLPHASR
jgi:ABC-type Fe3+/spermidine/putrescine transport system ATPase subunit